jgi:hypothetical protein
MGLAEERSRLTAEVFALTGKKCAEDDPIIVAALFQTHSVRAAGREIVEEITGATQAVLVAVSEASRAAARAEAVANSAADDRKAIAQAAAAAQKALANTIDSQIKKAVREAGRVHSTGQGPPQGWRGVLAGVALGIFVALGTMLVACNFSLTWFSDARFGAEWKHVLPSLDPALRDKMIEHFEKHRR